MNRDLSDDICQVIAMMMAKDPRDRYQTPNELIAHLDLLKQGSQVDVGEDVLRRSSIDGSAMPRGERRRLKAASSRSQARSRQTTARNRVVRESARGAAPSWIPYVAGAGGFVLVGLALLFVVGGNKRREDVRFTADLPQATSSPPLRAGKVIEGTASSDIAVPTAEPIAQISLAPSSDSATSRARAPSLALQDFCDAEAFEEANPEDITGAIAKYEAVARNHPGSVEAGKVTINVARLKSMTPTKVVKGGADTIRFLPNAPVIDGSLSDWMEAGVDKFRLCRMDSADYFAHGNRAGWHGPGDLSADVYCG